MRLSKENEKDWNEYYQKHIVGSIFQDESSWMPLLEGLEDLEDDDAYYCLHISLNSDILLWEILYAINNIHQLEEKGKKYSADHYDSYLKRFNNAKEFIGDYDECKPIEKPSVTIHKMYTYYGIDDNVKISLNNLFKKSKFRKSPKLLKQQEDNDQRMLKEIQADYEDLHNSKK